MIDPDRRQWEVAHRGLDWDDSDDEPAGTLTGLLIGLGLILLGVAGMVWFR